MADTNASILQQIESDADYYGPDVYAGLLTYYSNLTLGRDTLESEFTPLSAVDRRGRNPKLFVIGVLPPPANVLGRLLDRSATSGTTGTVTTTTSTPTDTIPEPSGVAPEPSPTVTIVNGQAVITAPTPRKISIGSGDPGPLPLKSTPLTRDQAIAALAVGYERVTGQAPSEQVLGLLVAQSEHETNGWDAHHMLNYNFAGVKGNGAHNFQYAKTFEYEPPPTPPKFPPGNPDSKRVDVVPPDTRTQFAAYRNAEDGATDFILKLSHRSNWWNGLHSGNPDDYVNGLVGPRPPNKNYSYFTGKPSDYLRALKKNLGTLDSSISPPVNNPSNWVENGSASAMDSRKQLSKVATTQITVTTDLGLRYQAAQRAQIVATQKALANMQSTPPLRMLVNPKAFTVAGEKITSDGNWGRNGPIIEHWGDQQDKISGSGSVAGFYSLSTKVQGAPGLTRMARNFSLGYQNFMSLYLLYRNNAGLFLPDLGQYDKRLNLSMLGSIYIFYDNILYIGSFDSFNVTEDDTKPFTLEYNFEFTVRATFLLDVPPVQGTSNTFSLNNLSTSFLPANDGDDVGGMTTDTPDEVTANIIDLGDIDALVASSPQVPGNEPGARLTKQQVQAEMDLTTQSFKSGEIDRNTYLSELASLNAQLAVL